MTLPQLRLRSEYSFRNAYGSTARLAQRAADIGAPAAGLVDTHGTWGHVEWEQECHERGITPMFGTEFAIKDEETGRKPRCWALASDLRAFYRLSSANPSSTAEMAAATGVVRFAGAALTDPEAFDYVDLNPRSMAQTRAALQLAEYTGKPLVVTADNDYPAPDDRERFLAWVDAAKMTAQHVPDEHELRRAMWFLDDETFARAVRGAHEVAERLSGLQLNKAPMIEFAGDLRREVESGRRERLDAGHIPEWTDEYQQRLDRELDMIEHKEYTSYFLVVADLVRWAKQHMLVGPARGSSAGSLVCYLLRITEVDPLVHGLLFERFIDVNRADLPDIDIDFNDQKRDMLVKYLADKYGADNVAKIGSINRLKPRSVIAHVGKKLGVPHGATFPVLNVLIEYSSGDSRYGKGLEDTIDNTNPGQQFIKQYPEAELMGELENHASHTGVHAAGLIVSNEPIIEYCTVREGVAQVDKTTADALNLLKIDALGLRTLGVIEDSGVVSAEELYADPLDDPDVLRIFDEHKFSGVFQFEGAAQRRVSTQITMSNFKKISHVTALARPGPLGGGATGSYIARDNGQEPIEYIHESMRDYLSDTHGVIVFQEDIMRIVREIGDFSWEDTSFIRKAMSGRKGREYFAQKGEQFVKNAQQRGFTEQAAQELWDSMAHYGAWSMNASHTTAYAMISYYCAKLKRYHPVEYAAACLRNAKDDEQTLEVLREMNREGVPYVPFDPQRSNQNWAAHNGELIGGFSNLIGVGPVKAAYYVNKRDEGGGLTDEDLAKLNRHTPKHHDLYPTHTMWQHIYDHPEQHNIRGPVKEFAALEDREECVVIAQMVRNERRDENEAVRAARRGYQKQGQTLFMDMFVVDDSVTKPVLARIKPRMWKSIGERIADRAVAKQDWFLIRGTWLEQFSMLSVTKIKCLTNPEVA